MIIVFPNSCKFYNQINLRMMMILKQEQFFL